MSNNNSIHIKPFSNSSLDSLVNDFTNYLSKKENLPTKISKNFKSINVLLYGTKAFEVKKTEKGEVVISSDAAYDFSKILTDFKESYLSDSKYSREHNEVSSNLNDLIGGTIDDKNSSTYFIPKLNLHDFLKDFMGALEERGIIMDKPIYNKEKNEYLFKNDLSLKGNKGEISISYYGSDNIFDSLINSIIEKKKDLPDNLYSISKIVNSS